MPDRYSFRFTQDETDEMTHILEANSFSRPPKVEMRALATSFSKVRQRNGMNSVRVDSVHRWFKRMRRVHLKKNNVVSTLKAKKSTKTTLLSANQKQGSEAELSERNSSGDEGVEEEMSEGPNSDEKSNEDNLRDNNVLTTIVRMDESPPRQLLPPLQDPVTEANIVIARLAKFRTNKSAAGLELVLSKPAESSNLLTMDGAKDILKKLSETSMVDFKRYEEDVKSAVQIFIEKGQLSETEKAELSLLPEKLHKIVEENEIVRKELAGHNAFIEKLHKSEETTNKQVEEAKVLEEKYNYILRQISTYASEIADMEAAIHRARTQVEKLKNDREEVAAELANVSKDLQSANTHYMILKGVEEEVKKKRVEATKRLLNNTGKWVRLVNSKSFSLK